MEMNHFISIRVQESSQIAEARRIGVSLAEQLNFSETQAGKVAIAITEAATNQIKHAGGGEILMRLTTDLDIKGIEVVAIDKGPGIPDVQTSLQDGYSTSGTSGTGLGAIIRQAAFCDIYSFPQKGTIIYMQFWASPPEPSLLPRHTEFGGISVPLSGEKVCGDGWSAKQFIDDIVLLIADGLGHGALAAEAAGEAIRLFNKQTDNEPASLLKTLHLGMKATRGAAVAVAGANAVTGVVRYAGIGNTAGHILSGDDVRHMVSHNGTLGIQVNKVQEFVYEWPVNALLVFATDGIGTQISLKAYPGLQHRHCIVIAAVLYRDFTRRRDDATIVVVRRKVA